MKLIFLLLKNLKTLLPYFLLIALYFFFINFETIDDQKTKSIIKNEMLFNEVESSVDDKKQLRISIPVVPYRQ